VVHDLLDFAFTNGSGVGSKKFLNSSLFYRIIDHHLFDFDMFISTTSVRNYRKLKKSVGTLD